jgi:5'-nucleotidase
MRPNRYSRLRNWITPLCMATALLAGCQSARSPNAPASPGEAVAPSTTLEIKLIAFNDLHGNLEPPKLAITAPTIDGSASVAVPAGGVAYMATAIATLKARNPLNAVVTAGDMIGASPLVSALFLDEPTIQAVNAMKIDFSAVGNHEFDKGQAELMRMQRGGCNKTTGRDPCQVDGQFAGANFDFLAANTFKPDGKTLFPAVGIKTFDQNGLSAKVAFIGMTLRNTPAMVTPAGVAGLTFKDEADTVNALIPELKDQGVDAIVVLLHQGGATTVGYNDKRCTGLSGDILPILDRLDPAVDVVVSGHTHQAYICDYGRIQPSKPFLLTSARQYGTLLSDITLTIDTQAHRVIAKRADNVIVQGERFDRGTVAVNLTSQYPVFAPDPQVTALVQRYAARAAPLAQRPVGQLAGPATRTLTVSRESTLGNLVADAQLAAAAPANKGGAQIAFTNPGGLRADLVPGPGGRVTYGQVFSVQPFGNSLVVKTFSGAQIRALLEQQFDSATNTVASPRVLSPSRSLAYSYDLSRPAGARIVNLTFDGVAIAERARYRVVTNSFLATGGDNFTLFNEGTDGLGGDQDVDALEAYVVAHPLLAVPATGRITNLAPR